jgi:pimeloyl-ACP methyl ester carboxylesterase
MQDKFVQTSHGRIHWLEAGSNSSTEPLILLHSNGCSAYEFEAVIESLGRQFRVFAWDMPGHGDSDPLRRHHSVADYADAVVAFMDAIEVERAWVAGASIGGLICVELAGRHARRVHGVAIVEAVLQSAAAWEAAWPMVETLFGSATQSFEEVRPRFRELTPAAHRRWNIDRAKAGVKTMMGVMWAIRQYDALSAAYAVNAPAAILCGDLGPMKPGVPEWQARLPRSPLHMLPGCGHFPMIDSPPQFEHALLASIAFMKTVRE